MARHQASTDPWVTNLRHTMTKLNDVDRRVLPLLDGRQSRQQLADALLAAVRSGELIIEQYGGPAGPDEIDEAFALQVIERELKRLAGHALLMESPSD